MLATRIQCRHEGVTLLSTLSLPHLMCDAQIVCPPVHGRRPIELSQRMAGQHLLLQLPTNPAASLPARSGRTLLCRPLTTTCCWGPCLSSPGQYEPRTHILIWLTMQTEMGRVELHRRPTAVRGCAPPSNGENRRLQCPGHRPEASAMPSFSQFSPLAAGVRPLANSWHILHKDSNPAPTPHNFQMFGCHSGWLPPSLEKKLNLSFNFSFGINPPRAGLCNNILGNRRSSFQALNNLTSSPAAIPWSASVKATRIAERYAPRKNLGEDFITDALNLKIEIKSTRSKLTNLTLVARLTMTSSHTVGGTSSSTTSRNPSLSSEHCHHLNCLHHCLSHDTLTHWAQKQCRTTHQKLWHLCS